MNIETLRILELTPDPNNARQHDDKNLKAIMGSLKEFGQRKPIVITEAGVIVAGNGTVEAAKRLGWTDIEVVKVPDDWTPDKVKAFAIADNRTAELANWNQEVLTTQLLELEAEGWELAEFGFEAFELPDEDKPIIEDEIPESAPGRVALGDTWQLGNHRLMCGDSSDWLTVENLLDEPATLLLTDPPYRYKKMGSGGVFDVGYEKLKKDLKGLVNFDPAKLLEVAPKLFAKGINAYFFCNTDLVPDYCNWAKSKGYNFNILTWHKKSFIPASNNHHYPDTEYLIFISKQAKFNTGLDVNYGKYFILDNEKSADHPTIKPLEILVNEIKISSDKNDIVVDLFAGSGSTLIACEQTNRRARVIELDPKYCDVILERWERLTGQKAELLPAKAN
jgi:site-specific DNA-methyltransferase (adenine-specific)